MASGEILAFIDDDAFPSPHWAEYIVDNFANQRVAGVAGPGMTPLGVPWQEEASGWMSASPLGAGPYTYRFLPGKRQFVDDFPSMNLAVRQTDFNSIGGFDSNYWPGEDTKLCLDLVHNHHRRSLWRSHLRQNGNYGLHRGFFARALPQTSLRPVYFGPAIMVLGLLYLFFFYWASPVLTTFGWIVFMGYLLATIINSLWIYHHSRSFFQAAVSFPVVIITHIWYGLRFLQGFFLTSRLAR